MKLFNKIAWIAIIASLMLLSTYLQWQALRENASDVAFFMGCCTIAMGYCGGYVYGSIE